MSNSVNLDDLGNTIEAIIDKAVNSQNYQALNQTIRQAVNTAVDVGGEAVRRAVDGNKKSPRGTVVDARTDDAPRYTPPTRTPGRTTHYQPNKNIYSSHLGSSRQISQPQSDLPVLYRNSSGKMAGGILKTVGGGLLTLWGSGGLVSAGVAAAVTSLGTLLSGLGILSLTGIGAGVFLLTSGIRSIGKASRFDKYVRALGSKTSCELQQLARIVGKSPKFVRKELKGMIDEGLFLEGHLDEEETRLITSDDAYVRYLDGKQKEAQRQQDELRKARAREEKAAAKKRPAAVQEVLDKGSAFILQIRQCNERIPGEMMSEKISRMEMLVCKIFDRVEAHPEVVPDLKKLMDYYLPMTVKLLTAYAEMDAQPIQGETILSSKKEIEATLDTLNAAFEKLLDSIFKETALDVSSDISVLQTLLAQEGLTDDELTQLRRKKE